MSHTPTFDRLAGGRDDSARYGSDGPTERELRLLGDLTGKRVLDLGSGFGQAGISFAQQGAVAIVVDQPGAELTAARARADELGVRLEWHAGDLADLAFLRADSVDLAFSAGPAERTTDLSRLLRQVQRVLRPNAPFVFSYAHPLARCVDADGRLARSYFDPEPLRGDDEADETYVRTTGEVFTELGRAGFRVDTLLELPLPDRLDVPAVIVWRARKQGS